MSKLKLLFAMLLLISTYSHAGSIEPIFNTPGFKGLKATAVEDRVVELISLATPGSSIHLSMYNFDRMPVARELLRASARGVGVNVVFDGALKSSKKTSGTPVYALLNGAESLAPLKCQTPPCITFCGGALNINSSCRGSVNNHNKFILFSNLSDGRTSVVAVSSANWTESQLLQANDLLVVAGDEALYRGTISYWNALKDSNLPVPQFIQGQIAGLYVFPNKSSDPVLDNLNQVNCQLPGSKIRVLQSRLTDDRIAIAQRLMELSARGCDVKVVARHEPSMNSPGPKMIATLKDKLIILPYEGSRPEDKSINSNHAKVVIINASMNGTSTKVPMVMTGSHNLNKNSLRNNDELMYRIIDQELFEAYDGFWERVVSDAGPMP